jgi:hypothetical protein
VFLYIDSIILSTGDIMPDFQSYCERPFAKLQYKVRSQSIHVEYDALWKSFAVDEPMF